MSQSHPNTVEAADSDPLVDALNRLERSIADASERGDGAIPAPRPTGAAPKSLIPEGMEPPVSPAPGVARPPTPTSSAPVPRPAPAPRAAEGDAPVKAEPDLRPKRVDTPGVRADEGARPMPKPRPAQAIEARQAPPMPDPVASPLAARREPKPATRAASAPASVETWSGETPVSRTISPVKIPPRPEKTVEEPVPERMETEHRAPRAKEMPAMPVVDDEIASSLLDLEEGVPQRSHARGNRRVSRIPLGAVLIASLLQLVVLAGVAMLLWPGIKRGIIEEARGGNSPVVVAARPGADANEGTAGERVDALATELEKLQRELSVRPDDMWSELEFFKARSEMTQLADSAINAADRAAYDKLLAMAGSAEDTRLTNAASAELARVGLAYATGVRSASHTLPVGQLFPSLRGKNELELGTDQLVKVLGDQTMDAAHRLKAAYLLADRRGGKAADALAAAVANDPNLDVVREGVMTFSEMTGYRTTDLLDAARLNAWWASNQARVKAVLGN